MRALFYLVLGVLLAACAHSPEPTLFALSARDGQALPGGLPLKIELRRTALPSYLDRPHIVRRSTAEQLEVDGDERWGAPLEEMVSATLAEDLSQRLPGSVVYTDSGAISSVADVRVEVQLFRFERAASGEVELLAEVAVHTSASEPSTTQRFALKQKPKSASTPEIVATLSRLLGQLSDGIATMIRRHAPNPASVSPTSAPPPALPLGG
jgi:uncharacterized lipoprotein YmbA